jgi:hypothetical protein
MIRRSSSGALNEAPRAFARAARSSSASESRADSSNPISILKGKDLLLGGEQTDHKSVAAANRLRGARQPEPRRRLYRASRSRP